MTETFPRQRAMTRNFTLGAPRGFALGKDGTVVTFMRSDDGRDASASLWVYDMAVGREQRLANPRALLADSDDIPAAERSRRERMRESGAGITAYSADESGTRFAFALGGRLFTVALGDSEPRGLDVTGPVIDPQMSPDGNLIAWSTGTAVHVCHRDGSQEHAVTPAAQPGTQWGLADFIAAEELGRQRGFWWSPASTSLLVAHVDESPVRAQWLSDPALPLHQPREQRYPAAGTPNALVELWLCGLDGTQSPVAWDTATYEYLAAVRWQTGHAALITVSTRDQRRMTTFAVDSDLSLRCVLDLHDDEFLEVIPGQPRWMNDDLISVRDNRTTDTRQIFIGEQAISPGGLQVMAVLGADEDVIDVIATDNAVDRFVAQVQRDGTVVRLTGEGVAHATPGIATAHGRMQVVMQSHPRDVGRTYELRRDNKPVHIVDSLAERPLIEPVVHRIRTGPHAVNTAVLFPRGHVPGSAALPVMLRPYGGPHGAQVIADATSFCEDQWFADQGYAVVIADGRGTPGRGPAWDHTVYHDFVGPVLEDQVAAVTDAAAAFPGDIDTTRVAITGWSFGGYLAALAVMERPDVFHVAVAGAPVTDWALYDTAYTERYLGNPTQVPEVYQANSLIARAHKLGRPLMLVHGLADDNVISAHTLALSGELLAHRKPHTVLPLSGVTHMTPQAVVTENLMLLTVDFFDNALRR